MSNTFQKILCVLTVVALCFTALGCGGGNDEANNAEKSPLELIEESVLVRPNKNEDFRYNIYTHYVEISECLSTKSNIVIPDTIQDLPVYKICDSAFENQTTFTTLTMTNNIIEIGANAFYGCINLNSVTLSSNLEIMGSSAFAGCENLKEITIPGTLTEIPNGAFDGCSRLLSVKIEKSKSINGTEDAAVEGRVISGAFSDCPELRVIWIPNDFTEISDGEFSGSTDNLTICGEEESVAAGFAAINLIDFKTEEEFKQLSNSALSTQKKQINETVMSTSWKLTLSGIYAFGSDFKYIINKKDVKSQSNNAIVTEEKTETVNPNENVIFLAFTVTNLSGASQSINLLDFSVMVDGYPRRINSYDSVKMIIDASKNAVTGAPLNGSFEAAATKTGCIAVRVPNDWQTINVIYKGDITLESSAYEINRDDINIKWCTAASQENVKSDIINEQTTVANAQ